MAAKIPTLIPPQSFEIVRDRIAVILVEEITNQFALGSEQALNLTQVALERTVPFDKEEMPAINVNLQRSTQDDQAAVNTDEITLFNIDCFQSGITTGTNKGDVLAKLKLHRLMGVVRAILENPRYKTLGFNPGFIMNRHVASMDFAEVDPKDGLSITMGRVLFSMKIPENTELITPTVAAGFDTKMTLDLTDKGYTYTIGSDPPVPESEWDKLIALIGRGDNLISPTGQVTPFRTNDDADIEATVFAPIRASNALKAQNSLSTNLLILNNTNEFGNLDRFVDYGGNQNYDGSGGSLIDIIYDTYRGMDWYRVVQPLSSWNAANDAAAASNQGGLTGWFVPSRKMLEDILKLVIDSSGGLDYSPFDISISSNFWTSTTTISSTIFAYIITGLASTTSNSLKATANRNYLICRKH